MKSGNESRTWRQRVSLAVAAVFVSDCLVLHFVGERRAGRQISVHQQTTKLFYCWQFMQVLIVMYLPYRTCQISVHQQTTKVVLLLAVHAGARCQLCPLLYVWVKRVLLIWYDTIWHCIKFQHLYTPFSNIWSLPASSFNSDVIAWVDWAKLGEKTIPLWLNSVLPHFLSVPNLFSYCRIHVKNKQASKQATTTTTNKT